MRNRSKIMSQETLATKEIGETDPTSNGRAPKHVYLFNEVDKAEAFVGGDPDTETACAGVKGRGL